MGEFTDLTAADGQEISAYRADPDGDAKGGVVVIQEIFGLNGHVRDVCDRLASEGYVALAPALFDRIKLGIELGYSEEDLQEGFGYMQEVGNDTPMQDIQAAADALKSVGNVGAVGFCWGGQLAWLTAKNVDVDCVVGYYGVAIHDTLEPAPNCPVLLHFADKDVFVPPEAADKVRAANPDMPIYNYPGAEQAMARTLAFFAEELA